MVLQDIFSSKIKHSFPRRPCAPFMSFWKILQGVEMFLQLIHMKYHQVKGKEKPRLLDYGFQILQLLEKGRKGIGEGITTGAINLTAAWTTLVTSWQWFMSKAFIFFYSVLCRSKVSSAPVWAEIVPWPFPAFLGTVCGLPSSLGDMGAAPLPCLWWGWLM